MVKLIVSKTKASRFESGNKTVNLEIFYRQRSLTAQAEEDAPEGHVPSMAESEAVP